MPISVKYDANNYMEAAMAPVALANKIAVLKDTWGHLAPKKNKKYYGFIVYAIAGYGGDMVILDADFKDLEDSPWLHSAMFDFVFGANQEITRGAVYRFDGVFRNYKFTGTRTVLYQPS